MSVLDTTAVKRTDKKDPKREAAPPQRSPGEALPLTPAVFHILLALGDSERHGYAIMQEVASLTDGHMQLGPGTLYRSIQRMLADGFISESTARPDSGHDDERRRYYRLTDFGRRVASAEAERLLALVMAARTKGILPAPQGGFIL
jgi:DNA-binding MarR family transcriptional regulator